MLESVNRLLRGFVQERGGNAAILFGLAIIPVVLGIGVAVDLGRAMIVRERMYGAADASALAIGSWAGLTEGEMKAKAQQFFDANYPPSTIGTVGQLDVTFPGDDIVVKVSGVVPTTFMRLANIDQMDVSTSSTITKRERNIELALALDTTGSMSSNDKIDGDEDCRERLVETLFDGKATSENVRIAVVPFAAAVNVGSNNLDSGWIDKNANSPVSHEDFSLPNTNVLSLLQQIGRNWGGCVRERIGAYELTDDAPSIGHAATLFAPYFAPDEPSAKAANNYRSYSNSYLNDGSTPAACSGSSWGGAGWGAEVVPRTHNDKSARRTRPNIPTRNGKALRATRGRTTIVLRVPSRR